MKYENLKPTLADQVKWLLDQANKTHTVPHGVKTVNPGEGLQLLAEDGSEIFWDWSTADRWRADIDAGAAAVEQGKLDLAQARADLDAAQGRIDATNNDLLVLDDRVESAETTVQVTAGKLDTVDTRLTTTAGELSTLKGTVGDVQTALDASDAKIEAATATAVTASTAAQDARSAAEAAEARVQALANAQGSLILNGGFEMAVDATAAYRYQTTLAHAGSYVARFTLSEGNKDIVWPDSKAAKGQSLELRLWARGVGVYGSTTMSAYLVAKLGDGSTQSLFATASSIRPSLTGAFQEYIYRFPVLPEGTRSVSARTGVRPDSTATGYVFMDEVTLHDTASYQEALDAAIAAKAAADKAAADALDAMTRANQAYDSAAGKNSIRHATTDPQGVGTSTGDVWWKWTSFPGGVVTGQWAWDSTAWREQKASHQTIASVDLGTATVGQLKGSYIEAGSITVDRLTIGVGGNQLADAFFTDAALRNRRSAASTGNWRYGTTSDRVYMELAAATTAVQTFRYAPLGTSGLIPTVPGRQWRIDVPMYLSSGRARINIRWYDAFGAAFLYEAAGAYVSGPGDVVAVADITSPIGAVGFLVDIYMPTETTTRTAKVYGGASVVVKNASVHIEDGAVTAAKVNAESVAGAVGQFVKVQANNVEVTDDLSARVVNAMTTNTKNLVVTESAILQHTTLLGTTVASELNVIGTLRGRDAILTGTIDVAQLNVTGAMSAEIVRSMDTTTKRLVVTEDAILNRATVVEGIVTSELIAQKINVEQLAAAMVTGGFIQTTTAVNRGVKINNNGINAWNDSGTQTIRLNGKNNLLTGDYTSSEDPWKARVSIRTQDQSLAALDLYGGRNPAYSDHLGIWHFDLLGNDGYYYPVSRVLSQNGPTRVRNDPGMIMWPADQAFGFNGYWSTTSDATQFGWLSNSNGLAGGQYVDWTYTYDRPFTTSHVSGRSIWRCPMVSVESTNKAEIVAVITEETASLIRIRLVNKSSNNSGAFKVRIATFNTVGYNPVNNPH